MMTADFSLLMGFQSWKWRCRRGVDDRGNHRSRYNLHSGKKVLSEDTVDPIWLSGSR
jgi:hypothetical protein